VKDLLETPTATVPDESDSHNQSYRPKERNGGAPGALLRIRERMPKWCEAKSCCNLCMFCTLF